MAFIGVAEREAVYHREHRKLIAKTSRGVVPALCERGKVCESQTE